MAGNRRKPQEGFRAQKSRALANFHKKTPPSLNCLPSFRQKVTAGVDFECLCEFGCDTQDHARKNHFMSHS